MVYMFYVMLFFCTVCICTGCVCISLEFLHCLCFQYIAYEDINIIMCWWQHWTATYIYICWVGDSRSTAYNMKNSSKVNSALFMKFLHLQNFPLYNSCYIILGGSTVDLLCQKVLGAHCLHDHKQQALCVWTDVCMCVCVCVFRWGNESDSEWFQESLITVEHGQCIYIHINAITHTD